MFKLWSVTKPEIRILLKPDLGLRSWDDLTLDEKDKIWFNLIDYFFNVPKKSDGTINHEEFVLQNTIDNRYSIGYRQESIISSIKYLNETYMAKCFAPLSLKSQYLGSYGNFPFVCIDFYNIFAKEKEDVVMELLSAVAFYYFKYATSRNNKIPKANYETQEEYEKRKFAIFDGFLEKLNEVFLQFGIKWILTRNGFIPRQDEKIIEEIYNPVLNYLSDPKWQKVNEILSDAFSDYRKNTPQGYSGCLTKTIAAVEAYLQILVESETGKTLLSDLISIAIKKEIIPNDVFTKTIFKNIESVFARERITTGDAHPKDEYATEKNARMILNLAMIFIQHCILK